MTDAPVPGAAATPAHLRPARARRAEPRPRPAVADPDPGTSELAALRAAVAECTAAVTEVRDRLLAQERELHDLHVVLQQVLDAGADPRIDRLLTLVERTARAADRP